MKTEMGVWPTNGVIQMACLARYECAFKGQDILLETLALPTFRNVNYQLKFFGKGPDNEHLITTDQFLPVRR